MSFAIINKTRDTLQKIIRILNDTALHLSDLASIVIGYTDFEYLVFEKNVLDEAWRIRRQELVFYLAGEYDWNVLQGQERLEDLCQELEKMSSTSPIIARFMVKMREKRYNWFEALSPPCSLSQNRCYLKFGQQEGQHYGCCVSVSSCRRIACRWYCICNEPVTSYFATPDLYWMIVFEHALLHE